MQSSDFRRVVTNGLGRAVLWLQDHPGQPHEDAIQHVCLHNTAYDAQCEGSRAPYAFEIVNLTGYAARFAEIAARGLLEARQYWDTVHLFHLNRLFAESGHAIARQAIYEKFKLDDAEEHFIGADELIKLDHADGLFFVLDRIGGWIKSHPDHWVDDGLLRDAQEDIGPEVTAAVREAAETNPNVRTYLNAVETYDQKQMARQQQRPDYRTFTYAEMRERILTTHSNMPRGWLFGWGKHASDESIRLAAADLLNERDDQVLTAYLRLFDMREFPLDPRRLVELATAENADLATASRRALCHIQSDLVRSLAINLLQRNEADSDVVRLLVKNYAADDHHLIESMLDSQPDEDDFHWTAHAAVRVYRANPEARALASLLKIYENCRCSLCRNGAVKIMIEQKMIPPPILEECTHDSLMHTREIASAVA